MDFPKEFKSFEECEKFFADKNAGIFHGDIVAVRLLSNDSKRESKCVYTVKKDSSLVRDDSQTEPETKPATNKPKTETKGDVETFTDSPEQKLDEDSEPSNEEEAQQPKTKSKKQ